jgi:release factor glutamine methyltransferase
MIINKVVEQTVGEILGGLPSRLEKTSDTSDLDAQNLLAYLLDKPRSWILAHPELPLTRNGAAMLEHLVSRLEEGEPLPYVIGHWEFFGLEFDVTPDVLIPRPETELLVGTALAWLRTQPDYRCAADVGTGSGCIGISLAANVPDLQVAAMDVSPAAVEVARLNATTHGVDKRMEFTCGDLLSGVSAFNLIVANLPYIPTSTLHKLLVYDHEPTVALDGGMDGMELIRRLLMQAPDRLLPGGMLLMEIEASEGLAALSFAYDVFTKARIHLHKDLSGHDRLLEVQV